MFGDLDETSIFLSDVELIVASPFSRIGSNGTHNVLDTVTVNITIDTVMTIDSIITICTIEPIGEVELGRVTSLPSTIFDLTPGRIIWIVTNEPIGGKSLAPF
jgi:hypothetical protein